MNRILNLTLLPLPSSLRLVLVSLAFLLLLPAASASAEEPKRFLTSDLSASLQYQGSDAATQPGANRLRYRHQRQELRSLTAPTRYRTKSILRYSKELGDTGLVLRVKAPLKPRQMLKFELRF